MCAKSAINRILDTFDFKKFGFGHSKPSSPARKKHARACFFQRYKSTAWICDMRLARDIRLRRVICLRAWVDYYQFTFRVSENYHVCRQANLSQSGDVVTPDAEMARSETALRCVSSREHQTRLARCHVLRRHSARSSRPVPDRISDTVPQAYPLFCESNQDLLASSSR